MFVTKKLFFSTIERSLNLYANGLASIIHELPKVKERQSELESQIDNLRREIKQIEKKVFENVSESKSKSE